MLPLDKLYIERLKFLFSFEEMLKNKNRDEINMGEEKKLIGKISHYFSKIGVAVIDLTDTLKVGDEISVEGVETNLRQKVDSMEIEHEKVEEAKAGESIGLKVMDKVRENDNVYKVVSQ